MTNRRTDTVSVPFPLLETNSEGVILPVRAAAGAKRNRMTADQNGILKVFVTQIPEKGKANEAIRKQIAESFNIRISQVELIQGETSPQKKFLLRNTEAAAVGKRIAEMQKADT
ncbi:MAG: DUF167 domain-containing protein [Planctomycetaceae bacterium]|jgi:uncharacterized protein (TIGR00251 family)|nr:DUF167 domain-containing protein [Planctomycetaceae bacterium]